MAILFLLGLNFLVFVGTQAARIIFSLYALSLGAGPSTVGSILATVFIFPVLLSWHTGMLSDRIGAPRLMLPGIAVGALGMAIPYFLPSLASLYIAGTLLGLTITTVSVTTQNLVGVLSRPEQRARNFSNYSLSGSLTIFVGPLLGGIAIDHVGHSRACLVIVALFTLGMACVWRWGGLLPKGQRKERAPANLMGTLGNRRLWPMLVISSLAQVSNDTFQAFVPIYAHGLGMTASVIGVVMATFAAGSFCVRLVLVRLVKLAGGDAWLLSYAFFAVAAAYVLIPLMPGAVTLAMVGFYFGAALGCIQPLALMLMYVTAEEGRAGEAIGLRLTLNNVGRIVSPALFGLIGTAAGLMTVFWTAAALMGIGGRVSRAASPKIRR